MTIFGAIFMGLREIWAHKLRSFLTMFCVMLGVTSVVVTVGYMRGLTAGWKESLKQRGGVEKLSLRVGRVPSEQRHLAILSPGHTLADAEAVQRHVGHVKHAIPVVLLDNAVLYRGRKRDRTDMEGVLPEARKLENFEVASGRFITDADNLGAKQVMVLGNYVYENLFEPGEDPIGQKVMYEGLPFDVVGLLKEYELNMGKYNALHWKNDLVFIPLTTAQKRVNGTSATSGMDILVDDARNVPLAVDGVENTLRGMHRGIEDFYLRTNEGWSEDLEKQEKNQVATGAAVSLITILIGGIGIMNLMLASINERVREIGIRKAIGARKRDLFFQFSVESVTLCVLGGLTGVMAGQGITHLLRKVIEEGTKPEFTMLGVVMGFVASVVIGILAGLYPAVKAARMDPIEALRHE